MKITAYVPCFNGETTLAEVLEGLRTQTRQADQYLLINDHSTDGSVAIAHRFGFEVADAAEGQSGLGAVATWRCGRRGETFS